MKKAVILVADQVQDQEFWYPYYRLQEANYTVEVVAPSLDIIKGKYGIPIKPTASFSDLKYILKTTDVIIIPGGWGCPEILRMNEFVLEFLQGAATSGRHIVIGAICHGPWVLASAGLVKDKKMTCYKGMKDDLINAGAKYEESDIVVDSPFVTAPHYKDNPGFMREILRLCDGEL